MAKHPKDHQRQKGGVPHLVWPAGAHEDAVHEVGRQRPACYCGELVASTQPGVFMK